MLAAYRYSERNAKFISFRGFFFIFCVMCSVIGSNSPVAAQTVIWEEGFEGLTTSCSTSGIALTNTTCVPAGWLTGGPATASRRPWTAAGQLVRTGSRAIRFVKPEGSPYVGWLMTQGAPLYGGETYYLTFYFRISPNQAGSGGFALHVGATTSQTTVPTALTQLVSTTVRGGAYAQVTYTFVPPANGTYYFGIRATTSSTTARENITIDDMSLWTESTLPVELLSFSGECSGEETVLSWSTASEQHNAFFEVESSEDGIEWNYVDRVEGANNSNILLNYTLTDSRIPTQETVYYRLTQHDFDGSNKTYGPIAVHCGAQAPGVFHLYPNPAGDRVQVKLAQQTERTENIQLRMYDITGRQVLTQALGADYTFDVSAQPQGVYFVELWQGQAVQTQRVKLVKQ